jgi:CCR4-NOT transcription complex subunit 1
MSKQGWTAFHRLMTSLLRFLAPFLRKGQLGETIRALYSGTLRIFLVLLHDFPDWLARFGPSLVDIVPVNCIQLQNVICSSYPPQEIKLLPDPFSVEMTVESIPELARPSPVFSDHLTTALQPADFRTILDTFLRSKTPPSFLTGLKERVILNSGETQDGERAATVKYNEPLIRAVVLYSGLVAMHQMKQTGATTVLFSPQSAPALILSRLVTDLEPEGRYLALTAVAQNLRYPSAQTGFFAEFVFHTYLHGEEKIREQIVRVLLERILVSKVCVSSFVSPSRI